MDSSTTELLKSKYPAKAHCRNVISHLRAQNPSSKTPPTHFYLESARTRMNEDNDQEAPFRQRRYFFYLTGCELPDSALIYDIEKDRSTLFVPPVNEEDVIWSGLPLLPEQAMKNYDVDEVLTTTTLAGFLGYAARSTPRANIFAIPNQISHIDTSILHSFAHSDTTSLLLKTAIDECRVIKDSYEIALIRRANYVSGLAHREAMRAARTAKGEADLEAAFISTCIRGGCRHQAYPSIVASGTGAATLHYVKNDKTIDGQGQETLNVLLDAGCEDHCYASDITRTFPVRGKFSKESREIYDIVLRMQNECMDMLKAGVIWDDVHALAHRIAIDGLLALGILKGGDKDEIFAAKTSVGFLPHGLGHYLGLDTHDTGGHANYNDPDPMFRYLRKRGPVPAGSVITVEPGIYFCRFILEPYLKHEVHGKYIDKDVLDQYWSVGGVRIEDDVLVKDGGCENLTDVEREAEEIEGLVMGKR